LSIGEVSGSRYLRDAKRDRFFCARALLDILDEPVHFTPLTWANAGPRISETSVLVTGSICRLAKASELLSVRRDLAQRVSFAGTRFTHCMLLALAMLAPLVISDPGITERIHATPANLGRRNERTHANGG